jgi:hypothetical protein
LDRLYAEIEGPPNQDNGWRERLEERLYMKGRQVRFVTGAAGSSQVAEGLLRGIGPGGELLLQCGGDPGTQAFVTGELDVYG